MRNLIEYIPCTANDQIPLAYTLETHVYIHIPSAQNLAPDGLPERHPMSPLCGMKGTPEE